MERSDKNKQRYYELIILNKENKLFNRCDAFKFIENQSFLRSFARRGENFSIKMAAMNSLKDTPKNRTLLKEIGQQNEEDISSNARRIIEDFDTVKFNGNQKRLMWLAANSRNTPLRMSAMNSLKDTFENRTVLNMLGQQNEEDISSNARRIINGFDADVQKAAVQKVAKKPKKFGL